MRKVLVVFLVLIALMLTNCNSGVKKGGVNTSPLPSQIGTAIISFKEYEHDFGKVTEGEKIAYVFTFENKGTSDLVITAVTTTCGCTVPKYDSKPLAPGNSGNLEVVFDTSDRSGIQAKTITVKSNASTPVVLLKIISEVVSKIN